MTSFSALFAAVFISAIAFQSCLAHGNFYSDIYFNWGAKHAYIYNNGDDISLLLDKSAGSGVQSYNAFLVRAEVFCIPVRVFRNYKSLGVGFPDEQGMQVYSSLWNADNWATRGGLVKIDWTRAPFKAGLRKFNARACKWNGPNSIQQCAYPTPANWWTAPAYKQLSWDQQIKLKWMKSLDAPLLLQTWFADEELLHVPSWKWNPSSEIIKVMFNGTKSSIALMSKLLDKSSASLTLRKKDRSMGSSLKNFSMS
ncbi:probable xyloglucan endotransglucosylase/hydrolase protein 26 [Tanacetum coccineum]